LQGRSFDLKLPEKPARASLSAPLSLRDSFPPRFMQSFSSLAQEKYVPAKGETQGIEAGAQTGLIIHRILERYFNKEGELSLLVSQETHRTKLAPNATQILLLLQKTLALPLGSFCLNDVSLDCVQTEMEFLYSTSQGWMKGYIDLCFIHEDRFYVIDWKTNLIENTETSTIEEVMKSHDYHLQGKIYSEAIQKYLSQFPDLSFGGVYFIFIRGPGCYLMTSPLGK
jgi:exodeoxyribonuclease V beta subunit